MASKKTSDGVQADSKRLEEVHKRALTRFDTVATPQQELRAQALEARRFVTIPGAQWEGAWGEQFENMPRPEVDKITKSLEKIEGDYRENRLTVEYRPADDIADSDTAETLNGMHRADSDHFNAMQARDNAFQEGIRGGFGAWRICTEYDDELDPQNERQRINPAMVIVDADQSVYFDGGSKLYDKSDAKWAFVVSAEDRAAAADEWGAENIAEWPVTNFAYAYDWYQPDLVRIAEYYEIENVADKLIVLTNDITDEEQRFFESEIEAKEIADLKAEGWASRTSEVKRRRVHKYILNGSKVLKDCGFIAGPHIPIVPFYGRRDWVDNMERFRGHVLKRMDRQRIYNSSISKLVETQSISPQEVPIVAPEQVDSKILEEWSRGNIDRKPLRLLKPIYNPDGTIGQLGPLGKIEPPQVQPADAALLQISAGDLTDEDENADEVKANVSADAMDIAASRVDAKSSIYLDNMRLSVQREAVIYRDMGREVYFEPGRVVETLSLDGQTGTETLAEPHLDKQGVYRVRNDLTRGKYNVVADVQESTSTRRQKTVRQSLTLGEIAGKLGNQELGNAALITAVMNMDGEGMADFQKYARRLGIGIGIVEPTPEEQQELAQQQQANSQPSAADQALQAQAAELASKAQLNQAKGVETLASAALKHAQAEQLGGPSSEPEVPSGLSEPEVEERFANAELKRAQAEQIRHGIGEKRVRLGHEIEMDRRADQRADREPKAA